MSCCHQSLKNRLDNGLASKTEGALRRLALLLFAFGAATANATIYQSADILFSSTVASGGPRGEASSINDAGQVVGFAYEDLYNNTKPFVWSQTNLMYLSLPAGATNGGAYDINNSGAVVGSFKASDGNLHAVTWQGGTPTDLNLSAGGPYSVAVGLNNNGKIVGYNYSPGFATHYATLWNGGVATHLSALSGLSAEAVDINSSGQIVGYSPNGTSSSAVTWIDGNVTDLGLMGGRFSTAWAINDAGKIVGTSSAISYGIGDAILWEGTSGTILKTLGGAHAAALDINNIGQIVGTSEAADGKLRATLWDGADVVDLNGYLGIAAFHAGWVLTNATGINSEGSISGIATNTNYGGTYPFVIYAVPVPEPGTYALLLAGLAVFRRVVNHRRTAAA